ncbi:MAG TPA: carbamoyltransferase N-terminal domain-containing protein, partial [Candidatus Paceibacterota bacterium]
MTTKNVLGIKIVGHDPGAALISGERFVAISEERLNRIKYSTGLFPHLSISYCLDALNLKASDIDLIVMDAVGEFDEEQVLTRFKRENNLTFPNAEIKVINHHLAHAASAFFCSPFQEAAIMVVDGAGSKTITTQGEFIETETLYHGEGAEMCEVQKTRHPVFRSRYPYTFGIGKLYTFITRRVLSFGLYNEGKTMGLSSYGDAKNIYRIIPKERWMKELSGDFLCNPKITYPGFGSFSFRRFFRDPRKVLINYGVLLLEFLGDIRMRFTKNGSGRKNIFSPIHIPFPPRPEKAPLPEKDYNDVAAVVQDIIEDIFLGLSRKAHAATNSKNLCIAGGCGLNGVSNNKILHDKRFREIFIQPASSDTGIPLGCALWGVHTFFKEPRRFVMRDAYLGCIYPEEKILEALKETKGI